MTRHVLVRLLLSYLVILAAFLISGLTVAGRVPAGPARAQATALIVATTLVLAVVAGLVGFLLARGLARPVDDLNQAFRNVATGEFNVRVHVPRRGRARQLADGFNEMAYRTGALVAELKEQREALDTIIASITEGLAVLDDTGRILLANASFQRVAGEPHATGKYYWETIRDPHLAELMRMVAASRGTATRELLTGGRVYTCNATYLPATQRIILTLHDITDIEHAARVKREFLQNVSHELRTPLTAIKGFAETMQTTIDQTNRPYLDTIIRNTDRLVSLVQDILALSELEDRGTEPQFESVDLKEIAGQMIKLFEKRARDKGIELKLSVAGAGDSLSADRFKLEQVFINLLDNAVKYTDKGEVELAISRDDGKTVIKVRDTGPGIAPEHLPRLFERFYVVDKGRSRQLGGTGLGLSIVKHIVLLHSGEISVESTPGVGTTFRITLPADESGRLLPDIGSRQQDAARP